MIKLILKRIWYLFYEVTIFFLKPLNYLMVSLPRKNQYPNSVLHISYMVHVAYQTTRFLRLVGVKADYLATGSSKTWDKSDFISPRSINPIMQAILEFFFFWRVVSKYENVHLHFGQTMSISAWELPILKKIKSKIIVHFRGCEIRNYHKNILLHPEINICQNCDYNYYCISPKNIEKISWVSRFGDKFLVTTPDLKDFVPNSEHIPFFYYENKTNIIPKADSLFPEGSLKILHWTNHPGIEGTNEIFNCIERLKSKGYRVELKFMSGVSQQEILNEIPKFDLTIGKMKMGYYANAQIESMALGVPAITYIREDFLTKDLLESGFIICNLNNLEETLEFYLLNPNELLFKKSISKSSIKKIHNNTLIANKYKNMYIK